jgi:hypothetical protein
MRLRIGIARRMAPAFVALIALVLTAGPVAAAEHYRSSGRCIPTPASAIDTAPPISTATSAEAPSGRSRRRSDRRHDLAPSTR